MKPLTLSQFPEDTYVFIKNKKREDIFNKIEKKLGYLTKIEGIIPRNLYEWRYGKFIRKNGKEVKRYIPLPKLKKLCKIINININDLQPHIQEIKTSSRSGIIKNPKLPLKITPETFALLGHFIADGYGGEKGVSRYINVSEEARENFIKKLKKVFGNIYYSTNPKYPHYVNIAKIIPKILKKYFKIKDFRNSKPLLTKKILNAPKKYLIEFIKAIIIDEGSVRDIGIEIGITANPKLTNQIRKICIDRLNYKCIKYKNTFRISTENYLQISKDMNNLIIPQKQERFQRYFKRKSRKWYNRYKNSTKKEIIKQLLNKPMDVIELSGNLNIFASGVRDQIKGYDLKGKRVLGLIDLEIVRIKNLGYRNIQIFEINNKDKALSFLKGVSQ